MAKKQKQVSEKKLHEELIHQMLALATSGFGLVAALAWNSAIQGFVEEFLQPKIPGSGLIYKVIYAVLITTLAVFITYQLSRISAGFANKSKN